jgi:hypothetical protein
MNTSRAFMSSEEGFAAIGTLLDSISMPTCRIIYTLWSMFWGLGFDLDDILV